MHLEKILQSQGFGSRKQCRLLIDRGQVSVDGETCRDGKVDFAVEDLAFCVSGKSYQYREQVYIALHKPAGFECSHHPQRYRSVFSLFPPELIERGLQSIGRLDQDTTGLLLLTDDGKYLHALTHPRRHVPKRYQMITSDPVSETQINALHVGVELHGETGLFQATDCKLLDEHTLCFTIHQGVYHQVKRMVAAVGNAVESLSRIEMGGLHLSGLSLEPGQWCYLDDRQKQLAAMLADIAE